MSEVTTIQLTAKRFKRHKLIAGLIMAMGFPIGFATDQPHVFIIMFFGGLLYWWLARVLGWWHHG